MPYQPTLCQERILSEDYMDFILSDFVPYVLQGISKEQLCEQTISNQYRSVYVESAYAAPLRLDRYSYFMIPKCYAPLDMAALGQAGILQIQNYPTLQLLGEGVMIGFIDTGIDYTNPLFQNLDGSTRIEGIWDQTIQQAPPKGQAFGTEYTREMIDAALQSENPLEMVPTQDEQSGHGTFLASVTAGGANPAEGVLGAAPEATIGVVKLKPAKKYLREFYFLGEDAVCFQENDIMLGIQYLDELATKADMPLVICLAMGTNLGSHNGDSPLGRMLSDYANRSGRVVVLGTGNEANARHHYSVADLNGPKEVEIRVGEGVEGFVTELWTEVPNLITVSVISPSGQQVPNIPLRQGNAGEYQFFFERTTVYIDYRLFVEGTNSELVFFRFRGPAAGLWRIIIEPVQTADGIFHMWLPIRGLITGDVFFLQSNSYNTITEPGNAMAPMTTAYYNGRENSIDINSGRGYTRNMSVKPDFTAPGVDVKGAVPGGRYAVRTGSSIATGITAGASALLLEWVVYQLGERDIDSIQIKNLLILGTQRKPGETYPNREWGYGSLNLYHTFENIRIY